MKKTHNIEDEEKSCKLETENVTKSSTQTLTLPLSSTSDKRNRFISTIVEEDENELSQSSTQSQLQQTDRQINNNIILPSNEDINKFSGMGDDLTLPKCCKLEWEQIMDHDFDMALKKNFSKHSLMIIVVIQFLIMFVKTQIIATLHLPHGNNNHIINNVNYHL